MRACYRVAGQSEWHRGFTTNISLSGLFLATGKLQPRGTRVRVELLDKDAELALEGVVRWARQVPPALRSITSAGFGIRFFEVAELMEPLVVKDGEPANPELGPEAAFAGGGARASKADHRGGGPSEKSADLAEGRVPASGASAGSQPPAAAAVDRAAAWWAGRTTPLYRVDLATSGRFLDRFESELIDGVLFIETPRLLSPPSEVTVELRLPAPHGTMRLPAHVVLRLDADTPGAEGKQGVAVEFHDRRAALERLRSVVRELEAREL